MQTHTLVNTGRKHLSSRLPLYLIYSLPALLALLQHYNPVLLAIRIILSVDISFLSRLLENNLLFTRLHSFSSALIGTHFVTIPDAPWIDTPVENCATEVSFRVKAGIIAFVPSRKYQLKPQSFLWFTAARPAAIADSNHCVCM